MFEVAAFVAGVGRAVVVGKDGHVPRREHLACPVRHGESDSM